MTMTLISRPTDSSITVGVTRGHNGAGLIEAVISHKDRSWKMYNPTPASLAAKVKDLLKMHRSDADYVTSRAWSDGSFAFRGSQRFVFGSRDDVLAGLQETGKDIARELGIPGYGVFYHYNGRLIKAGIYTPSEGTAHSQFDKVITDEPHANPVMVRFNVKNWEVVRG